MAVTVTTTFTDGSVATAASVNTNVYAPSIAKGSLAAVNSRLDKSELVAGYKVVYNKIRIFELFRPYQVGSRHHLHFLSDTFREGGSAAASESYIPISDNGMEFFLERQALVRLSWTTEYATDVQDDDSAWLGLFIGSALKGGTVHRIPSGLEDVAVGNAWHLSMYRWYCGHYWFVGSAGWNSAGIRVFGDRNTASRYVVRVQRRSFRVMVMRWDAQQQ